MWACYRCWRVWCERRTDDADDRVGELLGEVRVHFPVVWGGRLAEGGACYAIDSLSFVRSKSRDIRCALGFGSQVIDPCIFDLALIDSAGLADGFGNGKARGSGGEGWLFACDLWRKKTEE